VFCLLLRSLSSDRKQRERKLSLTRCGMDLDKGVTELCSHLIQTAWSGILRLLPGVEIKWFSFAMVLVTLDFHQTGEGRLQRDLFMDGLVDFWLLGS